MQIEKLTGADLSYWVARANVAGHPQERNIIRSHYGSISRNDPIAETSMRNFVFQKIGPVLPERSSWN